MSKNGLNNLIFAFCNLIKGDAMYEYKGKTFFFLQWTKISQVFEIH